jgi:hypothetical protein
MIQIKLKGRLCLLNFTAPNVICVSATVHELSLHNNIRMFLFLIFTKIFLLIVYSLNINQHTAFRFITLTAVSPVSPSDNLASIMLKRVEATRLKCMASMWNSMSWLPTEFHNMLNNYWGQRGRRTDRQSGDIINIAFIFMERNQKKAFYMYTSPNNVTCHWIHF